MFADVWKKSRNSVCALRFYNEKGTLVDTLSGFKVKSSLVTAEEAFFINNVSKVVISFCSDSVDSSMASLEIPYKEFVADFGVGLKRNSEGYAIFNIDLPDFAEVPCLEFASFDESLIGRELVYVGFQEGLPCQVLKRAFVTSSFRNSFGRLTLVLDGNFGYGNSGGPLLDPKTGKVLGIVNRRITSSAKYFEKLVATVNENISMLKQIEGRFVLDNVDPVQVLIVNQNQLKFLSKNIYQHSNSLQAFAILPEPLIGYFQRTEEDVSVMQTTKSVALEAL